MEQYVFVKYKQNKWSTFMKDVAEEQFLLFNENI